MNTQKKAVVIYDKTSPLREAPLVDSEKETGVTEIRGPILPFNKTVNMAVIFENVPHISPPKKKSKKEKKSEK